MTMRPFYLQVPLLVNYHFLIGGLVTIQPFAGVYGGVGVRGMMKTQYGSEDLFGDRGFSPGWISACVQASDSS